MSHTHLSTEEQQIIVRLKEQHKFSQKKIAVLIDKSPSCISNYLNGKTHNQQKERRGRKSLCTLYLKRQLEKEIIQKRTPEQIHGFAVKNKRECVHFTTIYQWIKQGKIDKNVRKHLPHKGYRRQSIKNEKRGKLIDVKEIEEFYALSLPAETQVWEIDTVMGKQETRSCLLTIVERVSKRVIIRKQPNKTMGAMQKTLMKLLRKEKQSVVILSDRGKEFGCWKQLEALPHVSWYFCDPQSPQQRGLNENTNKIIRRYFPKQSNFDTIDHRTITSVERRMNNTPRKTLGFATPNECYHKVVV